MIKITTSRASKNKYLVDGKSLIGFEGAPDKVGKPGDAFLEPDEDVEILTYYPLEKSPIPERFASKTTQTDFRESEAQTDPWDPPYIVRKVYKDPEVLSIAHLTYGQGLPATFNEVKHLSEKRNLETEEKKIETIDSCETLLTYKHVVLEKVKSQWNYKRAVENEKLSSKLAYLQNKVATDFQKHAEKKEACLKTMWMHKKDEMSRKHFKLEKKLHRDLVVLESNCRKLNVKWGIEDGSSYKRDPCKVKSQKYIREDLDDMFSDCLEDPSGLSIVRSWLEKKTEDLTTRIPLISKMNRTAREKIAEKAYQDMLDKNRIKMPPKKYQDEVEQPESPPPVLKTENVLEIMSLEEKPVNNITILQQALRGFAYQKQMLEMIARHENGLSTILPE